MNLYQITVYVHVVSAIIWVGGILFLGIVAVPAARRLEGKAHSELLNELGSRFRGVGYALLGILIVTGVVQMGFHGATPGTVLSGEFFRTRFGATLGMKLLFFVLMLVASIVHDFFLGPATVRLMNEGRSTERHRKAASWLARITAVLALVVVAYATLLVR